METNFIALLVIWVAMATGLGITILIVPGIKAKGVLPFIVAVTVLGLINALMIMLAAALVPGFEVKGFGSALLGAIVMAIIGVAVFISAALLTGAEINWYSYEYHSQALP